jgi:hypothetical protein
MADDAAPAEPASAPVEAADPSPKLQTREQKDAADKAAFMAAMAGEEPKVEDAKPSPKKPATKPAEDDVDDEEDVEAKSEDEDDDEIEDDDAPEDDEDAEVAEVDDDPKVARGMLKVQRLEQRMREQFDADRRAVVQELTPKYEAAAAFEKAKADGIFGLIKHLDIPEDSYTELSQMLWAMRPEAKDDPKTKESLRLLRKKFDSDREIRELKEWRAGEIARQAQESANAQSKQVVDKHLARIPSAIATGHVNIKAHMQLDPKRTSVMLNNLAIKMSHEAGTLVDPKKVTAALEKKLAASRAKWERINGHIMSAESAAKATAKTEPAPKPISKTAAIKVVDKTAAKPTPVVEHKRANGSVIPSRDEMLALLDRRARGELDPD